MRLAFMGTPEFSVPVLAELAAAGHDIAAVYTQAPKPSGRGHKLTPSPVHKLAESFGLDVRTPKNFKAQEEIGAFRALDLDVAVVVAYGLILPQAVLEAPRLGCLNLHASLLPRWRGAAPIQRAIMAGDKTTGVQVMKMEAGLDTGPILLSETVTIADDDTAGSLHDKLSGVAAQLGPRALAALDRGALTETEQAQEGVTYAEKISPAEARIDWSRPAAEVDRHVRGLAPFPGAWFEQQGARVKVLMSRPAEGASAPGEILDTDEKLVIACGEGAVELVTLQRAGKKAQTAEEFLRGFALEKGATLS
ncbi:methionyl-tRNA formyltransferase [Hyphococcus luteus]|uniref:Methionyl-tRNA formyltransferase n=1 Tax=Hyphococcus luteus TaxID=2058213 RepID=A0A2S7K6I6_9PROT|nr:methionyl-tRNA formyltransferase [Marinicaulis flavus]PQA88125.1 methionyl-tRNA formyltransferase [Marinicaulis flavus]